MSSDGGIHGCPGQHLAQLQTARLMQAFVDRSVQRFEITGETRRSSPNITTHALFNRVQKDFPTINWTADHLAKGIFYHARELNDAFTSVFT